ncbi:uncharacterized protein LOC100372015 [Saccoglossus kowalevskii]
MMKLNMSWDRLGLDSSTSSFTDQSDYPFRRAAFYGSIDRRRIHSAYAAAPISLPDVSRISIDDRTINDSLPSMNSELTLATSHGPGNVSHSPLHYADAPITTAMADDVFWRNVVVRSNSVTSSSLATPASSESALDKQWVASSARRRPRSLEFTPITHEPDDVQTPKNDNVEPVDREKDSSDKIDAVTAALSGEFITAVKLRTTKPSMSKEERRSSSGNWSGTDSTRNSINSEQLLEIARTSSNSPSDSAVSLDSDAQTTDSDVQTTSSRSTEIVRSDSDSTLNNDTADNTPTSSVLNTPTSEFSPVKSSFTAIDTETWLQMVAKENTQNKKLYDFPMMDDESVTSVTDSMTSSCTLTNSITESTTDTLTNSVAESMADTLTGGSVTDSLTDNASDLTDSVTTDGASSDVSSIDLEYYLGSNAPEYHESDSSVYSVDTDGYYTSMRLDCGIKDYKAQVKVGNKSTAPPPPVRRDSFSPDKKMMMSSSSSSPNFSSPEIGNNAHSRDNLPSGVTKGSNSTLNSTLSSECESDTADVSSPMHSGLYTLCFQGTSSADSSFSEKVMSTSNSTEGGGNTSDVPDDGENTPTSEHPPTSVFSNNVLEHKIQNISLQQNNNIESPPMKSYSRDKMKSARAAFFGFEESADQSSDIEKSTAKTTTSLSNMKTTRPHSQNITNTSASPMNALNTTSVVTPSLTTPNNSDSNSFSWIQDSNTSNISMDDVASVSTYALEDPNENNSCSTFISTKQAADMESPDNCENKNHSENSNGLSVYPESYKAAKLSFFSNLRSSADKKEKAVDKGKKQRPQSLDISTTTWPYSRTNNSKKRNSLDIYGSLRRTRTPDEPKSITRVISPPESDGQINQPIRTPTKNTANIGIPGDRNSGDFEDKSVYFMPWIPRTSSTLQKEYSDTTDSVFPSSYSSFTDEPSVQASVSSRNVQLLTMVEDNTTPPIMTTQNGAPGRHPSRKAYVDLTHAYSVGNAVSPIQEEPVSILKDPMKSRFNSQPKSILKRQSSERKNSNDLFSKIHASKRKMKVKSDSGTFPRMSLGASGQWGSNSSLNSSCSVSTTRSITFSDIAYVDNMPVKVNLISGKPQTRMEDFKALLKEHNKFSHATESAMSALYINTNVARPSSAELSPSDTSHSSGSDLSEGSQSPPVPRADKMVTISDLRSVMHAQRVRGQNGHGASQQMQQAPSNPTPLSRNNLMQEISEKAPVSANRSDAITEMERTMVTRRNSGSSVRTDENPGNMLSILSSMKTSVKRNSVASSHGSEHGYTSDDWQ